MLKFPNRRIAIVAAALAAGFAATCHAADTNIDACQLISAAQASRILGTNITVHPMDTSAAGPGAGAMCRYGGSGIGGGFMLIAGRVHYTNAATEVARREKQALSDTPPGIPTPSFTDIKGLGDAAYLAKTSAYFQLNVLAHGTVIVINRNMAASAKSVEQAKQLARVALTRLK
jgi:IMP dehydrogenase/GMP reductase